MEENKNFVIVIGRQFGSGGRELGRLLASRLGVPYYDKRLLNDCAEMLGFRKDIVTMADECRPSFFSWAGITSGSSTTERSTISQEKIYEATGQIIRKVVEDGSCVIVGRTADYIAREHPGLVSVFVHAPLEQRAHRIMAREGCKKIDDACDMARKRDKLRERYYNYFTGRHWGAASNYDLCIDSSKVSMEQMADIIIAYLNHKTTFSGSPEKK